MVSVRWSFVLTTLLGLVLTLPLVAGPQGRILGTVEDEQGEPIADAEVVLTGDGWDFEERFSTNKKGRFTATVADATRQYAISVSKEGYVGAEEAIDIQVGDPTRVTWNLPALVEAPPEGVAEAIEAYNRGAAAFNAGDREAAITALREAIDLDPDLTAAKMTLAKVLFDAGRYPEAADMAQQWMDAEPGSDRAVALALDSLVAAGDSTGAAALVDRLGDSEDPETAKRIFNAGAVAVSAGNRQAGIELMGRAAQVDPTLVAAHSNLARLYAADDNLELAEQHARATLELAPQDPGALITLFDLAQRRDDLEAARSHLEAIKSADPTRAADILGEQSAEYINLGRLEIAAQLADEALALDPANAKALLARASLALNQNDLELAKQRLQAVIDAAPGSPQADQAREMLDYL